MRIVLRLCQLIIEQPLRGQNQVAIPYKTDTEFVFLPQTTAMDDGRWYGRILAGFVYIKSPYHVK